MDDIRVRIGAEISGFSKAMSEVEGKMSAIGQRLSGAGQAMATTFGAAGGAIAAGLGLAVNKSMDFEAQVSRVGAIAGATGTELDALRQSALELGASTSKSASEVAVAQEGLAALGFTTQEIIGALPGVISAAESSGSDMALTANVMAGAINAFNLEASDATRVADILAQTANQSGASMDDMGYAFKYAAPVAQALGISIEELSASVGILTDNQIDGSSAGTALRAGLIALLNPSEENSKMMESMGVAVTDANGEFLGLSGVIANLGASMEGMTEAQKLATLASLVGTEASTAFLTLMNAGPAKIDKMTESLENSSGASATAAAAMKDNLKGAIEELGGAFETAQISIGTALTPAIRAVTAGVTGLINIFNSLSPSMQKFIAIGAAVAAGAMLLVAAFGAVLMVIGNVLLIAAPYGGVMAAIGAAMSALLSPVVLIIAGLVALGAAFAILWAKSQTFRTIVTQAFNAIKTAAMQVFSFIRPYIIQAITAVQSSVQTALSSIRAFWQENGAQIMSIVRAMWSVIKTIFTVYLSNIVTVAKAGFTVLAAVVKTVFNVIKTVITTVMKVIGGIIKTVLAVMRGDWSGALNAIKGIVSAVFNGIRSLISNVMNGIRSIISSVWNGIRSTVSSVVNGIRSVVSSVFNALRGIVSGAMNGVRTAIVNGWNSAKSFLEGISLSGIGKNIIQGLINGITSMIGSVGKAISSIGEKITGTISKVMNVHSPSRVMMEIGGYTTEGLAVGITKAQKMAMKAAESLGQTVNTGVAVSMKGIGGQIDLSGSDNRESVMETNVYLDSKQIGRGVQRVIDNGQRQKLNVRTAVSGVRT